MIPYQRERAQYYFAEIGLVDEEKQLWNELITRKS